MDSVDGGDVVAALTNKVRQQFGDELGDDPVIVRWALVVDVLDGHNERGVVALADQSSVAYEAKALVREALSRGLFDGDEDGDEDE